METIACGVAAYLIIGAVMTIGTRAWLGPPVIWEKYLLMTLGWPLVLVYALVARPDHE